MSLKPISMGPIIVLAFFLVASAAEVSQTNGPASDASHSGNPAIVKDEVFIAKENGTQVEWRHIVLKGNNTQIGMAQAEISQRDYGVNSLTRYADPVYGKARQTYMERNYPMMEERMKGIAMAYGLSPDNASFDTNTLPYDMGSLACSMIYFPPQTAENGHAITARNLEWYLVPMDLYLSRTENATGNETSSRNFLLEIYPDQGYSTLAIGTSDLNIVIDGLNSVGLGISLLVDEGMEPALMMPLSGDRNSGIMSAQMTRLVLDTCKSVEEAKIAFLANKEYLPMAGVHYMVYDDQGNSAIIEWNRTDGNLYFTDGNSSKPNIMTNHPMFIFSKYTLKDLLREDLLPFGDPYNTFNRYIRLDNITSSHKGKFSEEDAAAALREVFANTMVEVEGATKPLPINTIYNVILDLNERSLKVKFYLKNGPVDPVTNETTSVFSPYLTFKMNDSTMQ
ncbi:MAG: C45 family autoproteolytic acyltransferase/hydrolase [Methanothrix sp.]